MDTDTEARLARLEESVDATYRSVEKIKRYFQIMVWVSLAVVVLPAIGLLFAVPAFLNSLSSLDGLI